jgi:hypothetical protein
MGLKTDLKFKGNDFSHVATAYSIAHLVMQAPNGKVKLPTMLQKVLKKFSKEKKRTKS